MLTVTQPPGCESACVESELRDRAADALGFDQRAFEPGLGQHHHELFAAVARGDVGGAHLQREAAVAAAGQHVGDAPQQAIARRMAVAVVVVLEVIDVDEQQRRPGGRGAWRATAPLRAPLAGSGGCTGRSGRRAAPAPRAFGSPRWSSCVRSRTSRLEPPVDLVELVVLVRELGRPGARSRPRATPRGSPPATSAGSSTRRSGLDRKRCTRARLTASFSTLTRSEAVIRMRAAAGRSSWQRSSSSTPVMPGIMWSAITPAKSCCSSRLHRGACRPAP